MKDIGNKLKNKRISLHLTYDDITKITKMPEEQIRAIEEGDMEFFENDLTFLRFYVRKYCNVLDVSFDEMRDDLDNSVEEFTQTLSLQAIREREEIEENIAARKEIKKADTYKETPLETRKDRKSIRTNLQKGMKNKPNVDLSLISLLAIIVVIVGILVYVVFNFGGARASDNVTKIPEKETTPIPEDKGEESKKEEEKKEETAKVTLETVRANEYIVNGLKLEEEFILDITFQQSSWVEETLHNPPLFDQSVYGPEKPIRYVGKVQSGMKFALRFGNFNKDQVSILINGVKVEMDPQIATMGNVLTITFTVQGE